MHSFGQLIEFFESCFGEVVVSGHGDKCNINVLCPICHENEGQFYTKKKLAIKADSLVVKCWVCNYKSRSVLHLLKTYFSSFAEEYVEKFCSGNEPYLGFEPLQNEIVQPLELPNGFLLLAEHYKNSKSIVVSEAIKYLQSRGATYRDFWYFKYGVSTTDRKYFFRVIIPSFNDDGELNFFTSRSYVSFQQRKYFNPLVKREDIIFNEINIDWTRELTVTEGPFDLLKCNENATCLLGSTLETNHALFQRIVANNTPILLALDNDALDKQLSIAKSLMEYGIEVRIYEIPKKYKDVGEMTSNQFIEGIPRAKLYTPETELEFHLSLL